MERSGPSPLVAEPHDRHARHLVVRMPDGPALDHRLVGEVPIGPRELFVLVSPEAHRVPSLGTLLPEALAGFTEDVDTVWLAVSGLAAETEGAQRLAKELDVEIVVPDGGVLAAPGAALYSGHTVGGLGWHRFRPDRAVEFHGARFPLPDWEAWLPSTPVEVAGLIAVPAPCGLLVRDASAAAPEPTDVAFGVPVEQSYPKIVVNGGPPSVVAALLRALPKTAVMVVPATREVASPAWQAELARRLSRDVVFSAGLQTCASAGTQSTIVPDAEGNPHFRPFPIVLRQPADGGRQQVLDIAPAPVGWERAGESSYRLSADGSVLADVLPSGLLLRPAGELPAEPLDAPFDPEKWTLTLGVAGQVVPLSVLTAAENLLSGLSPGRRALVRVRLSGVLDEEGEHALDSRAAVRRKPAIKARPEAPAPAPVRPSMPPIMTTSAAPVSTVSGHPAAGSAPPSGFTTQDVESDVRPEPEPAEQPEPPPRPPVPPAAAPPPPRPPEPEPPPAGRSQGTLAVPVRPSTAAEQTRFTAAAGESFSEALATVNAALATWPSMRVDESLGAKADYVAVCLYLGRGDGDARAVNDAVRQGLMGGLDGQIPCLASGIRRLPTHRRAVLRQGRAPDALEYRSTPGTVLTEPGFLTASVDLDVTMPGAEFDVLIWPSSARRTSELILGRPVDEAVFLAGARFKALAVRTADDDQDEAENGEDTPAVPKVAILFRELTPGETTDTTELDERDLSVLAKLDRLLGRRQRGKARLVDDAEVSERLTTSMVAWHDDVAKLGQRAAVAS